MIPPSLKPFRFVKHSICQVPAKILLALLLLLPLMTHAEECVFDESAYTAFIRHYASTNSQSKTDGKALFVEREDESIVIKGGGCDHLGVTIQLTSHHTYTEEQFLHKTWMLSKEFGSWLINIHALEESIKNRSFQIIDGIYFITVDAMTVFSASYHNNGIDIEFYIN